MSSKSFDVVIVGAGSAGAVTAFKLCNKGFQVALIERKDKNAIGRKICGDMVTEKTFDTSGIAKPTGEERKQLIKGLDLYSPSQRRKFRIEIEAFQGYIVERYLFGQRLLKLALDAGAQLFERRHATGILHDTRQITGVTAKALNSQTREEFKAKLLIDASGSSAVLRRKLPPELAGFIEPTIRKEDNHFAYREIRNVKQPLEEPEYAKIYFEQQIAPKGYIWIFPRGEGTYKSVNTGLGGWASGHSNFKTQFRHYIQKHSLFKNSEIIDQGSGFVPRRRAMDSLVTNGLVLVGDAGCQVNPLSAGGIDAGLEVGAMITKTFEEAVEKGDFTAQSLWSYNVQYQRTIGRDYGLYDMIKTTFNKMTNKEMDFVFDRQILDQHDISRILNPGFQMLLSEKIRRGLKGLRKPLFLLHLNKTSKLMTEIRNHYENYPANINHFVAWQTTLKRKFYPNE
ncbi:MAG: geranylgeranyl reductase family protein [Candidatus Hermodarchaeota archaeon]